MKKAGWIFLLLSWTQILLAQQNSFITYNTGDGMAQSQVRAIAQDHSGYLWFGTLGGLSRFDGHEFKNFSRDNGLPDNQINTLLQGDSVFWVGSTGALCQIDGLGIATNPFPHGFENARVIDMLESPEGGLWLGLGGEGLLHWDGETFQHFGSAEGLPDSYIRSLAYAKNGDLWIGTRTGLVIHRNGRLQPPDFPGLYEASVSDILLTPDNITYVCTFENGIYVIENESIRQLRVADGLVSDNIRCAAMMPNGDIWVGSIAGLNRISEGEITTLDESQGMPYTNVKSLGVDREGNLWIGTDGQGVFRQAGKSFTVYNTSHGLLSDAAMDLVRMENGNLIIGSYDQGLTIFDGEHFSPYSLNDSLPGKTIWQVATAADQALWVGTSQGLFIEKDGKITKKSVRDSLPGNRITAILPEGESIWIGAENGMALLNQQGEILKVYDLQNFSGRRIRSMKKTGKTMWIGAEGQLIKKVDDAFQSYPIPANDDAALYCIETDLQLNVWVGTSAGLYVLEPGSDSLKAANFSANYSARNINFLSTLEDNTLLIGTNNGLYRLNLDVYEESGEIRTRHYTAYEGLRGTETNQNALLVEDEQIWFGTTSGLVKFEPFTDGYAKDVAPKINLTGIQLFLQDVDWSKRNNARHRVNGTPINPVFDYKDNYITFNYTGIYFNNPDKVKYRYMLQGADSEWLGPTRSRSATYAYLPHGSYTFILEAYSDDDPELIDRMTYSFQILPPFYLKPWFFILCGILLLSLLYAIYQNRIKKEREKRANLQLQYQSRMLELESQTLNSSMNRHFIFNALNSIQYYINMQDKRSANRYLSSFAKLIRMNLDSSQQALTKLGDELERLELYLTLEKMRFQDRFDYIIEVGENIDLTMVEIPAMMLQPFLENSIWHGILPTDKRGEITVKISSNGAFYQILIADNGIGIDTSIDNKRTEPGSHISKGMEITQSRILLYKRMTGLNYVIEGPVQMQNAEGEILGTKVLIKLPKRPTAGQPTNISYDLAEL